jgi:hypothetical protein
VRFAIRQANSNESKANADNARQRDGVVDERVDESKWARKERRTRSKGALTTQRTLSRSLEPHLFQQRRLPPAAQPAPSANHLIVRVVIIGVFFFSFIT